jgi:ABC-type multidrug transport system fused ATPase/permease subunit
LKQIFKTIVSILLPAERRIFFFLILLDVVISLLDIVAIALLLLIVNFYTNPLTALPAMVPKFFFDKESVIPVFIFLMVFIAKNATGYFISRAQYHFVYNTAYRLSQKKMLAYLEGSYINYVTVDAAVHIKKISQQPVEFAHYVLWGMQQIGSQSLLIGISIVTMMLFNVKLFLLLFIILMPAIIVVAAISKYKTKNARTNIKTNSELALQYLKEAINGFVESKLYQRKQFFTERYIAKQQQLNQYLSSLQAVQAMPTRLMEIFAITGFLLLLLLSRQNGNLVTPSVLTIGAFMAAAYKIIPGMVKILNNIGMIKVYRYTIDDLKEDTITAAASKNTAAAINTIEYKEVCFCYPGKNILQHFNCTFKTGDFTGISATSGKGKTTLVNLLLGFEEPTQGAIWINNENTGQLQRQQYCKNIAYVKQQPFVINDSIINNITLGERYVNHQQLQQAITLSGLTQFIAASADGIHKIITENGKNISGGQQQRIVIARALYKNADVIILDEPFNELDRQSELELLLHFKQLAQSGKMVILITHNKESLSFCNNIITLDEN